MDTSKILMVDFITDFDVEDIVKTYVRLKKENVTCIQKYQVINASDKLLGFLGDYFKLQVWVNVQVENNVSSKVLSFFIKAISRVNAAKASMVRKAKLFENEMEFYTVVKKEINYNGLNNWSPEVYAVLNDAIVFEDLSEKKYQLADKLKRLDMHHTKCALEALAKFHGSTIVYEHFKCEKLKRKYSIEEDFRHILRNACFVDTNPWYQQCAIAALAVVKHFSKYTNNEKILQDIERNWHKVWSSEQFEYSSEAFRVICHRDLWNNNLLFHYQKEGDTLIPDDAVMVDFQAIRYEPPACDIMMLLYCNVEPKTRELHMKFFLKYYYSKLSNLLKAYNIVLETIITYDSFLLSAEKCRKWGLIASACLFPAVGLDDSIITNVFGDSKRFDDIMNNNKASFVIEMINKMPDYKRLLLSIFEEIVERYCMGEERT